MVIWDIPIWCHLLNERLFINGEFVPSISGRKFNIYNLAIEQLSASIYEADANDVDVAVKAAQEALPSWSALSASERGAYLFQLADAMERAMPEIRYLEAISMGRPVHSDFSSASAPALFRYFADKAMDFSGETSLNTANMVNITLRQPYGVCGAIIPWNAAMAMIAAKVAPALIAGNTMVLKTSEKAPLSAAVVARCAQEAGMPKGILNILNGYGTPCGEAIAKHVDIRRISFTGSEPVGRLIKKAAADSNLKKVTLELGGKAPLIVFKDANIEKAVGAAALSILANTGQFCMACSRIYVHESIADKFVTGMKAAMATALGDDPLTKETLRGPQADKLQFDRVMSFLDYAKATGLDIQLGGGRERATGFFVQPTIIYNAPEESRVVQEEIFGPVVCINTFEKEDDALARANNTQYGLYASVFTEDISRALRVAKRFEAGNVGINCASPTSAALDMPIGGWKASGDGRDFSQHSLNEWTQLKSLAGY
ncbi:aldehyde dehydrogenase [Macrophomina phaseolina]|uniref:aldehyde dehydrogenase (NAD(+)) n=1 Tax=Macrophomina phaseolina TaxID=35725 RepID=A0ABQ8G3D6_9PEZI|nr:aldehyde dehydrogenase [Macrophomina phaseolina]